MGCITKKLRGYGFLAQMMQLPIVMLQRTKYFRGRKVFNNICFWISMILGLSIVSAAPCRVRSNRWGELTFRWADVCAICSGLGVLVPHQSLGALCHLSCWLVTYTLYRLGQSSSFPSSFIRPHCGHRRERRAGV